MRDTPPKTGRPLVPIILTVFLDLLGVGIVIPIAAPLLLDPSKHMLPSSTGFGTRSLILGFLLGSYSIAQFFGAPVLGSLADQYGRKRLWLLSLAGSLAGYLLFALGIVWRQLDLCFLSRILDGFTGGNISIAMSSIADISKPENRARNFGLVGMSFGLGFILGPFLGGKLADPALLPWFNLATPYYFAALLSVGNLILLAWLFRETLGKKIPRPVSWLSGFRDIRTALSDPGLRFLFGSVFLLVFGFNFFTQFFQVFLIARFHYGPSDIADMFAFIGLCLALTQGLLTRPISRLAPPGRLVSLSVFALAFTFPLLLLPRQSGPIYLILPALAFFNGVATPNLTAVVSLQAGPESQGRIMGIRQSMQAMAMALPPIIAGLLTRISVTLPLYAAGFFTLAGWFVFRFLFRGGGISRELRD